MTRPLLRPVVGLLDALGFRIERLGGDLHLERRGRPIAQRRHELSEYTGRVQMRELLDRHGVTCVLDVGANDGGFVEQIRRAGWQGRIVSFEPQRRCRDAIGAQAAADGAWRILPYALSDAEGTVALTLRHSTHLVSLHAPHQTSSAREYLGSSHDFDAVGTEEVPLRRLDGLTDEIPELARGPLFLKIDTQGHDDRVLAGASGILPQVAMLQVELSQVPLYENTLRAPQMIDHLAGLGFALAGITPILHDSAGALIEFDGLFVRPTATETGRG